ncbi:MAG: CRTAC1 family protein [Acidobacteria bacterium]|nr:CRTAC1 family protein [Acidobacteriota bacterium]
MGGGRVLPRESPKAQVDRPTPAIRFQDVSAAWGLTRPNVYGGAASKKVILEMTGNGVGVIDVDNDGRRDLIFVNGTRLGEDDPPGALLYHNLGDSRFQDATADSGLTRRGWGQGVCAGDYDNDGFTDLLVTYYGHNALYRNAGGKRFEETTAAAGLPVEGQAWGSGCAFFDSDRDGDLDLFVSNYVGFDLHEADRKGDSGNCSWRGLDVFCGPRGYPSGRNWLFENQGDGTFRDVSREAGILLEGELHYGLGVVAEDFDDDGFPDVYVACDSTPSILYRNRGAGTFEDVSVVSGVAYGAEGQEEGSMGVSAGDFDRDGRFDLLVSNFIDETPTLYRNEGELFFTDETYQAGLGVDTSRVGWGALFVDFDQDGWKDAFLANGHIYPELDGAGKGERFAQAKLLFWNLRNGAFREVARELGEPLAAPQVSRGAAVGDLDGDGRLEIAVVNMNGAPSLYRTDRADGAAVLIELVATRSNRSAIGARVTVEAGGAIQTDAVRSGGSYASQSDFRLHFGLGGARQVDKATVRWPTGEEQTFENLPANAAIRLTEGSAEPSVRPFSR